MQQEKWALTGEFMESCNCSYLCPCIYTNSLGAVTHDHCTSIQVYRVDNGHYGSINLDGLKFALVIRSGKVMSDGNWIFAGVVDSAANEAQRTALAAIVSGEAGGPPSMIRDNLVSDFRGVEFKPIEFNMGGLNRSTTIGDFVSFEIDGVPSKSEKGSPLYIANTEHPANHRVALAQAKHLRVHGFGLDDDLVGQGNNGHFAPFRWAHLDI